VKINAQYVEKRGNYSLIVVEFFKIQIREVRFL